MVASNCSRATYMFSPEAVVGLERTFYSASEAVRMVEVCAIVYSPTIDCPISFPFAASLSTSDNTAGIICSVNVFVHFCVSSAK